jgi:hypothetical protein
MPRKKETIKVIQETIIQEDLMKHTIEATKNLDH